MATLRPTLTYGCETWKMTSTTERKQSTLEIKLGEKSADQYSIQTQKIGKYVYKKKRSFSWNCKS